MNNGFTLIEILIAIVILGMIGIVLTQSFLSLSRANVISSMRKQIKQSGDFALQSIERLIRESHDVESICDGSPTPNRDLILVNRDGFQTRLHCDSGNDASSAKRIASTSGSITYYLTPSHMTLGGDGGCESSSLTFSCISSPSGIPSVQISFELFPFNQDIQQVGTASGIKFQTTVQLRK